MLQGTKRWGEGGGFMVSGIQDFENLKCQQSNRFINNYKAIKKFNNVKRFVNI